MSDIIDIENFSINKNGIIYNITQDSKPITNFEIKTKGKTYVIKSEEKPLPQKTFSDITDDELIRLLNAYYNGSINLNFFTETLEWKTGDKRKFHRVQCNNVLSSTTIIPELEEEFTLLDFEHDDLEIPINNRNKALLSLGRYSSNFTGSFHETQTDATWNSCSRKNWFNTTFYNSFDLKDIFKSVIKKFNTYSDNTISQTVDKMYLLSLSELLTSTSIKDGEVYKYWQDNSIYNLQNSQFINTRTVVRSGGYYMIYGIYKGSYANGRINAGNDDPMYYGFCL